MTTELLEKGQLEAEEAREITFKCKICGKIKPLNQLREMRRFFPLIVACADCDDKMSYIGKRIKRL